MSDDRPLRFRVSILEVFVIVWITATLVLILAPAVVATKEAKRFESIDVGWWDIELWIPGKPGMGHPITLTFVLSLLTVSGGIAATATFLLLGLRQLAPQAWRGHLAWLYGPRSKPMLAPAIRAFVSALAALLLVTCLILWVGPLRQELHRARLRKALNAEAVPLHGMALTRRNAKRDSVELRFAGPLTTDEHIPQVVALARTARSQNAWSWIAIVLSGSRVTDDGVRQLLVLDDEIDSLRVDSTEVTSDGVRFLRESRPRWSVDR